MLRDHLRVRRLAHQQAPALVGEPERRDHEDAADDDGRGAVEHTARRSWWLRNTPTNATARPEQRRRVLEEDGEQARVLAVVDGGDGARAPRLRPAERAPGDAEGEALEDRGEGEHDVVDGRALERRRVLDVGDALVDGHAAADAEDAHGDDEAPEVDLHAVAERVVLVGGPGAPVEAVEEQAAVAGVDDGVDALADHRRAAGDGARR